MNIERALALIEKWRSNVRFFEERIKAQKDPGYNFLEDPFKGRMYTNLDVVLEKIKIDIGIQRVAEEVLLNHKSSTKFVTLAASKKERDSLLVSGKIFAIKNDDEDYPYIIFELSK